jgi:hypothetical protein
MTPLFKKLPNPNEWFEKTAAIARMPDDEKQWPAHLLSELHKNLPFLASVDVDLDLGRMDPEAGYALGNALIRNKTMRRPQDDIGKDSNFIKIPIVITDRQLQPFHVFEVGGKLYPLTQSRFEQAMIQPALFDAAVDRVPPSRSLVDQQYPPYQQRQGFGRVSEPDSPGMSGFSKGASAPQKKAAPKKKAKAPAAPVYTQVPASEVLGKAKGLKLQKGATASSLQFLRIPNTEFVIGVPPHVASALRSGPRKQAAEALRNVMAQELAHSQAGRANSGGFMLFSDTGNGYQYISPQSIPNTQAQGK